MPNPFDDQPRPRRVNPFGDEPAAIDPGEAATTIEHSPARIRRLEDWPRISRGLGLRAR